MATNRDYYYCMYIYMRVICALMTVFSVRLDYYCIHIHKRLNWVAATVRNLPAQHKKSDMRNSMMTSENEILQLVHI